jgi:hypothetical protein
MDDREKLQLQIEIKKCFSNNKLSLTWLQTSEKNIIIDVLTIFGSHFRGNFFLFSFSEIVHDAGMCV